MHAYNLSQGGLNRSIDHEFTVMMEFLMNTSTIQDTEQTLLMKTNPPPPKHRLQWVK